MARLHLPLILCVSGSLVAAVALAVGSPAFARIPWQSPAPIASTQPSAPPATASLTTDGTAHPLFEGTIAAMPATLDFDYARGSLASASALSLRTVATGRIPFQRFDIAAAETRGRSLSWTGVLDPAREARRGPGTRRTAPGTSSFRAAGAQKARSPSPLTQRRCTSTAAPSTPW